MYVGKKCKKWRHLVLIGEKKKKGEIINYKDIVKPIYGLNQSDPKWRLTLRPPWVSNLL